MCVFFRVVLSCSCDDDRYDAFVEGGISTLQDLKDIESADEFVDDFKLKKAQARKIMKALGK